MDRRYNAQFTAQAVRVTPKSATQFPFISNIFGHLLPWYQHLKPGNLTVRLVSDQKSTKMIRKRASQRDAARKSAALTPVFRLAWQNENADRISFPAAARTPIASTGTFVETADSLMLPEYGVKLTLYEIKHDDKHLGYWVRYQRNATALFSEADVMLTQWTPVL